MEIELVRANHIFRDLIESDSSIFMRIAENFYLRSYEGLKVLNYETFLSPKQVAKTRNFFWGLNASNMSRAKSG